MSKRELKKYLATLTKEQLEDQMVALYDKFPPVKVYYNFVFQPNEAMLLREAKTKITHEYYPIPRPTAKRKPKSKMRRSVAQKFIKHFKILGVDAFIIADVMLYAIEIAQTFASENCVTSEAFYKSLFNSYDQAVTFCVTSGIYQEFSNRIEGICIETRTQKWRNASDFEYLLQKITVL
ncbi:MAG: DUF6155 family protein [Flavobacterium sp.]